MSGDKYNRTFKGDTAQCGCKWVPNEDWNLILVECPIHREATLASVRRLERERGKR